MAPVCHFADDFADLYTEIFDIVDDKVNSKKVVFSLSHKAYD